MAIFRKSLLVGTALLVFGLGVTGFFGCGSASNNDQGTSVLALGYFQPADPEDDSQEDDPQGMSGAMVPLATDVSGLAVGLPNGVVLAADGLGVVTAMGIENRLSSQYVITQRIDCSYQVPGAAPGLRIPSDSYPLGTVLDATGEGEEDTEDDAERETKVFATFFIVTPQLYQFLNVNRNQLPELPFQLIATCTATVVTQAGDTLTTNPVSFTSQFLEVSECCIGDGNESGFPGGPGTGGDVGDGDEGGSDDEEVGEVTDGVNEDDIEDIV